MKLSQLPTDNLYKFMALTGITVVIASLVPFLHLHKLNIENIHLHGEAKKLNVQIKRTTCDVNELKEEVDKLEKNVDNTKEQFASTLKKVKNGEEGLASEIDKVEEWNTEVIESELNQLEVKRLELSDVVLKQEIVSIEHRTKLEKLKYLSRVISIEFYLGVGAFWGGALIAIQGFRLWYKRLQVFQDKIVRTRAEVQKT